MECLELNSNVNSSWIFKSLCKTANLLKEEFKNSSCNPNKIDLWKDPCLMGLPINLKPTFLNKSLDFENLSFANVLSNGYLDHENLENIFGLNLDWNWIDKIIVDNSFNNTWIWGFFF